MFLGIGAGAVNDRIVVDAGTLRVTNSTGTAALEVLRGTNVLNSGLVEVDRLLLTNSTGFCEFNGGTLSTAGTTNNNGRAFTVGNGTNAAALQLSGGTHVFTSDLLIANHGWLTGNGTVVGHLNVQSGGVISPGPSVAKLVLNNSPTLQGTTIIEISKNGSARTNDQIQVVGSLTYGGSLSVSNLGPTTLNLNDNFKLFTATTYNGAFSSLILPLLNPGLGWTNKLLVDGSIEVVTVSEPRFTSISLSGTNLMISGSNGPPNGSYAVLTATNIALPSSNWVSLVTNQFGSVGQFSFTNVILTGEQQRYFRIRTP